MEPNYVLDKSKEMLRKHLHRYLSEFDFSYNMRKAEDAAMAFMLIRNIKGKRHFNRNLSKVRV